MLIGGKRQDSLKGSGLGKENTRVGAPDAGRVSPVARATQGHVGPKDLR
jgi:DNA-binding transcriptional regulator YdaS (Cro superfamily)